VLAFVVALLSQMPVAKPCPDPDAIQLGVGTQKLLAVDPALAMRSSNPEVVRLQVIGKQLVVIGAGEGSATVWIERDGGLRGVRVDVVVARQRIELPIPFPCGSTLKVKLLGDRMFIDGEANSVEEWRVLLAVAEQYPAVVVLGRLKPEVVDRAFAEARAALERAGLGRARWVRAGNAVLLEGELAEGESARLAAVEAEWRPKLELVLRRPRETQIVPATAR
jgi:pilus assembly protein CpaC